MPSSPYVTVDVFTRERFGGNQLAVFPDARPIAEDALLRITREFNYSETTFVYPARDPAHTRHVRIFTPAGEIPFAGHPTLGTAFVLAELGLVNAAGAETPLVLEEGVGAVPVRIKRTGNDPTFAELSVARLPEFGPRPPDAEALARALGLQPGDVLDGALAPEGASCGLPFLFIPVRDRQTLGRVRVRLDDFEAVMRGYWTTEVFVFCKDPERPGSDYRARMFAPLIGVPEDPATGSASAAFGGYLAKRDPRRDGTLRWVVEQGFEMGRPSMLYVEADKRDGATTAIRVGGYSVLVGRGDMVLD
ncbi:MAG TPA: PhzF family phenazine biosynthesis protein [Gemmatimonadaceae bacterium]|nr:PhzF family phenazine biosynthesis protein [Gemmatimonadaceae bacterium]